MTVQEKIYWMENQRGKNHPLPVFRAWLDKALPRHRQLKLIQVGGTNGKGSTCQWLSSLLEKAGYRTGVFTSPHLISHTERIRVGRTPISLEAWETIFDRYAAFFQENKLTMFEMDLFMAIAYFLEQDIQYGIIEVGMGGRLDATTALDYLATLITNVGMDHMEYLGNSLNAIAKEKAGIFKEGTLAIAYDTTCFAVMEEEALARRTSLLVADYDVSRFDLSKLAAYQRDNLILALSALEQLRLLKPAVIQPVIDDYQWAGRFMLLRQQPKLIVDGAHNVPGIRALVRSLPVFQGEIYFSALKEKEIDAMLQILASLEQPITLVHFDSTRLCDLDALQACYGLPCIDVTALMTRLQNTEKDTLVCGSLYFVGDVLARWQTLPNKNN